MGVEVDRQNRLVAQRREKLLRRRRLQQPGHVLDADDVGAGLFQFAGEADIIFEIVFGAVGIEDVAGVADGGFAELARLDHRIHRDAHVLDPIEAVEDAEEIHAGVGGLADEVFDDIVGVIGVADGVGAAQQHLEKDVGRAFADVGEAFPRILGEKAHGDVEGGAAPAFERKQARQRARIGAGDGDEIVAPHAGGEQRLVRVAHGGIGDEHALLAAHPAGEAFRAFLIEDLLGAGRRRGIEPGRRDGQAFLGRRDAAARVGMAVDGDIGDIGQKLGRPVAAPDGGEEFRRLVDEAGRVAGVAEFRVTDDVFEKGQVGGDAADAEFAERAVHAVDRFFGGRSPGGDFFEQRVVEAGDDRAGIGGAAVEADAEAHGAAIGGDAAVIRNEILFRVLGGDAALKGVAVETNFLLRRHAGFGRADGGALGRLRICALTMSMPVTSSVTVCSTWMRGLTSMK